MNQAQPRSLLGNFAVVASLSLVTACAGVAPFPEGEGEGLVTVDRAVPASTSVAARPEWAVGDRFEYLRGGEQHTTWRVESAGPEGYKLVQEMTGVVTLLDQDLGVLGEDVPDDPVQARRRSPVDNEYAWPLWVGKRWTTNYLRKVPGAALPVQAEYECDAIETISVPAGTFECYRIWRKARPLVPGKYYESANVLWYAPEVGYFVRKLENSVVTELQDVHRQKR